jgi:predicted dehydrogenase
MVLSGAVGNVWSPDKVVASTPWRHRKIEAGGGGTLDIGAHLFDHLRYQCGEIDEVSALARTFEPVRHMPAEGGQDAVSVESDADDTFMALVQFESGAIGNLVFSWAGHGERTGFDKGGAVYGAKGCLKGGRLLRDGQSAIDVLQAFRAQASPEQLQKYFPDGITNGFALEMQDFLAAIRAGTQPETSGSEGLKDIAPCLAILESSLAGRAIKVADVESCRIERYQQAINAYW